MARASTAPMIVLVIDDDGNELEANNAIDNRQDKFTKMFMDVVEMH